PGDEVKPYLSVFTAADAGTGRFDWDLSEPHRVPRALVLDLDPFEAARQLVQDQGLGAVVHDVIVPPIQTGAHTISISANLPAQRPDVLSCGAPLRCPPAPPFRMQAVTQTVEIVPPSDSANTTLKLSPKEELKYWCSTFMVVQNGDSVEQLSG